MTATHFPHNGLNLLAQWYMMRHDTIPFPSAPRRARARAPPRPREVVVGFPVRCDSNWLSDTPAGTGFRTATPCVCATRRLYTSYLLHTCRRWSLVLLRSLVQLKNPSGPNCSANMFSANALARSMISITGMHCCMAS